MLCVFLWDCFPYQNLKHISHFPLIIGLWIFNKFSKHPQLFSQNFAPGKNFDFSGLILLRFSFETNGLQIEAPKSAFTGLSPEAIEVGERGG